MTTVIARGPETYKGSGRFVAVLTFNSNRDLIEYGDVKADLVFDKGDRSTFPVDGVLKINDIEVDRICNDKLLTAGLFKKYSPVTLAVKTYSSLPSMLKRIASKSIVFKPVDGFGGEGIIIGSAVHILNSVGPESKFFPAVVQEFIDTSGGLPDITSGVHDLRVIIINGEIEQASIRKPPKGKLIANIKRGGNIQQISTGLLPDKAIELVKVVDNHMKNFGNRIYSVDMVYDGSYFKLLELNSRPGWPPRSSGAEAESFVDALANLLESAA